MPHVHVREQTQSILALWLTKQTPASNNKQPSKNVFSPFDLKTLELKVESQEIRRMKYYGQLRLGKVEVFSDISGFVLPRGEPWLGEFNRIIGRLAKMKKKF